MTTRIEDARNWLITKAGWQRANQLIRNEARMLRIDPTSDAALKHAIATYQAETGHLYPRFNPNHPAWQPPVTQGELL